MDTKTIIIFVLLGVNFALAWLPIAGLLRRQGGSEHKKLVFLLLYCTGCTSFAASILIFSLMFSAGNVDTKTGLAFLLLTGFLLAAVILSLSPVFSLLDRRWSDEENPYGARLLIVTNGAISAIAALLLIGGIQ